MTAVVNPTVQDRLLAAWRALVRAELPTLTYCAIYEYVVQAADGKHVDAAPSDTTISLPPLSKVAIGTGLPGTTCQPTVGSRLAVGFLNADPSRPIVVGVFDSSTDALTPIIKIAGPLPTQAVARVGDAVGPFLVTTGSSKVSVGG